MAKVNVDEGKRLDGFLGSWTWRRLRKESHTGLEDHVVKVVAKLPSRLAQPHAKVANVKRECACFECETLMSHFQQTFRSSRLHITRL
jgi:hypothetical protein